MTHFYTSQTYINASTQLDTACDWLENLGINCSRTRLGRYRTLFSALANCQKRNELSRFYEEYSFEDWVNAAYEVAEIVRIYEGLNKYIDPHLIPRLRDSLKGHELFVMDNEDRSGRDFSLELSVAAKFAVSGYRINFGHEADLEVQIGEHTFYIECKRLKSLSQARKRIRHGLSQLHKRYVKSPDPSNSRGFFAISIGKTINANLGLLEAFDSVSLGNNAFAHNEAFIKKNKMHWQDKVDKRTLGVAVILDAPGMITSEKKLVTCHQVTLNNCIPPETEDYGLFLNVAGKVFARGGSLE